MYLSGKQKKVSKKEFKLRVNSNKRAKLRTLLNKTGLFLAKTKPFLRRRVKPIAMRILRRSLPVVVALTVVYAVSTVAKAIEYVPNDPSLNSNESKQIKAPLLATSKTMTTFTKIALVATGGLVAYGTIVGLGYVTLNASFINALRKGIEASPFDFEQWPNGLPFLNQITQNSFNTAQSNGELIPSFELLWILNKTNVIHNITVADVYEAFVRSANGLPYKL